MLPAPPERFAKASHAAHRHPAQAGLAFSPPEADPLAAENPDPPETKFTPRLHRWR